MNLAMAEDPRSGSSCPNLSGVFRCPEFVFSNGRVQSEAELTVLQSVQKSVTTYSYNFIFKFHKDKQDPTNPGRVYTNKPTSSSGADASKVGELDNEGITRVCDGKLLRLKDAAAPDSVELHFILNTPEQARDYVVTVNGKEVMHCRGKPKRHP